MGERFALIFLLLNVLILLLPACTWEDQLQEADMEVGVAGEEIEGEEVQVHIIEVVEEDQDHQCTGEEGVHHHIMEEGEETTEVAAEVTLLEEENILQEDTEQIKKSSLNVECLQ